MSDYNEAYQKSLSRRNDIGDGLDFWATPPQATQALLNRETFYGNIVEPACGTGDMSEVILNHYKDDVILYSYDIVYRGYNKQLRERDFLTYDFSKMGAILNVVTNPPFNLAEEFIRKALEISIYKVAMLLKLEFLQATSRLDLFTNTPLKNVYVFSYRVPFWKNGYKEPISNQRHAWYVWEQGYTGKPMLNWIEKPTEGLDRYWWK